MALKQRCDRARRALLAVPALLATTRAVNAASHGWLRLIRCDGTSSELQVTLHGVPVASFTDSRLSSGYARVPAGRYEIHVSDSPRTRRLIAPVGENRYTTLLLGQPALQLIDDHTWPGVTQARLRVVNLAEGAHLTINAQTNRAADREPLTSFDLTTKRVSDYLDLPADTLQVHGIDIRPARALTLLPNAVHTLIRMRTTSNSLTAMLLIDTQGPVLLPETGEAHTR
jgi:hypothetical protein